MNSALDSTSVDQNRLFEKMRELRCDGSFCDLTINLTSSSSGSVNNSSFMAHKIVLVSSSPYFYSLFENGKLPQDILTLPSYIEPPIFEILLDYMYNRKIDLELIESTLHHYDQSNYEVFFDKLACAATFFEFEGLLTHIQNWKDIIKWNQYVDNKECKYEIPYEQNILNNYQATDVKFESDEAIQLKWEALDEEGSIEAPFEFLDKSKPEEVKKLLVRGESRDKESHQDENNPSNKPSVSPKKKFKSSENKRKKSSLPKRLKPPSKSSNLKSCDLMKKSNDVDDVVCLQVKNSFSTENGECNSDKPLVVSHEPGDDLQIGLNSNCQPQPTSNIKKLDSQEIKKYFDNPRDVQQVMKSRIMTNSDEQPARSFESSWHKAIDHKETFLGCVIPFGNSASKIWEGGKKILGEIRKTNKVKNQIELTLLNGEIEIWNIPREPRSISCPFCSVCIAQGSTYKLGTHFLNGHGYVWIDIAKICSLCNCVSITSARLKDHLMRYHNIVDPNDVNIFRCRKCGKNCRLRGSLKCHERGCKGKRKMGQTVKAEPGSTSQFTQSQSSSVESPVDSGIGSDESIKRKKSSDYVYDPHICSICGKVYKNAQGLNNHMSGQHGAPKKYLCKQEGCIFATNMKDPYIDHLYAIHRINVGSKPVLSCPFCEYSTVRKSSWKLHYNTHVETELKHECKECGKTFTQARSLRRHIAESQSTLVLSCEFCQSQFSTHPKLRRHIRVMHTQRIRYFKCAYCSHATVQRTNCRTHMKSVHRGMPVTVVDLRKKGDLSCENYILLGSHVSDYCVIVTSLQ